MLRRPLHVCGRFKPYPAYRDSGVEWLGNIPADWVVKRLKTVAVVQLSNVDKKSLEGEVTFACATTPTFITTST